MKAEENVRKELRQTIVGAATWINNVERYFIWTLPWSKQTHSLSLIFFPSYTSYITIVSFLSVFQLFGTWSHWKNKKKDAVPSFCPGHRISIVSKTNGQQIKPGVEFCLNRGKCCVNYSCIISGQLVKSIRIWIGPVEKQVTHIIDDGLLI